MTGFKDEVLSTAGYALLWLRLLQEMAGGLRPDGGFLPLPFPLRFHSLVSVSVDSGDGQLSALNDRMVTAVYD